MEGKDKSNNNGRFELNEAGFCVFDLKIGGNLFYLIFLIYFKTIVGKFQIIYIRLKVYFNSISNKWGKSNFLLSYITRGFDNHI